jgi:hypothetical protein
VPIHFDADALQVALDALQVAARLGALVFRDDHHQLGLGARLGEQRRQAIEDAIAEIGAIQWNQERGTHVPS